MCTITVPVLEVTKLVEWITFKVYNSTMGLNPEPRYTGNLPIEAITQLMYTCRS